MKPSGFESFMIYTTKIGGVMSVGWASRERYEEVKAAGRINTSPQSDTPTWVDVKMVAFAPLEELRDFALPEDMRDIRGVRGG